MIQTDEEFAEIKKLSENMLAALDPVDANTARHALELTLATFIIAVSKSFPFTKEVILDTFVENIKGYLAQDI